MSWVLIVWSVYGGVEKVPMQDEPTCAVAAKTVEARGYIKAVCVRRDK